MLSDKNFGFPDRKPVAEKSDVVMEKKLQKKFEDAICCLYTLLFRPLPCDFSLAGPCQMIFSFRRFSRVLVFVR